MTVRSLGGWAMGAALLLLTACQQPYLDPAKRHSSVGKPKAAILTEFGEPDEIYLEDGKEYLSYVYYQSIPYGYWNGTYYVTIGHNELYCRVTFVIVAEKVVEDHAVGQSCGDTKG